MRVFAGKKLLLKQYIWLMLAATVSAGLRMHRVWYRYDICSIEKSCRQL